MWCANTTKSPQICRTKNNMQTGFGNQSWYSITDLVRNHAHNMNMQAGQRVSPMDSVCFSLAVQCRFSFICIHTGLLRNARPPACSLILVTLGRKPGHILYRPFNQKPCGTLMMKLFTCVCLLVCVILGCVGYGRN